MAKTVATASGLPETGTKPMRRRGKFSGPVLHAVAIEECHRRFTAIFGASWDSSRSAEIFRRYATNTLALDERTVRAIARFNEAVEEVFSVAAETRKRWGRDIEFLRSSGGYLIALDERLRILLAAFGGRLERSNRVAASRTLLAQWVNSAWHFEPKRRLAPSELAPVSILLGNWPRVSEPTTAAEVIQAEAKAIREASRRASSRMKTPHAEG